MYLAYVLRAMGSPEEYIWICWKPKRPLGGILGHPETPSETSASRDQADQISAKTDIDFRMSDFGPKADLLRHPSKRLRPAGSRLRFVRRVEMTVADSR